MASSSAEEPPESTPNFRLGFHLDRGFSRAETAADFSMGLGTLSTAEQSSLGIGLIVAYQPKKGFGWESGVTWVRQSLKMVYSLSSEALSSSLSGAQTRWSVPFLATYQFPSTAFPRWVFHVGGGVALDFFDEKEHYQGAWFNNFQEGVAAQTRAPALVTRNETPRSNAASARFEANAGWILGRGSRLDFGIVYSQGLRSVFEGNLYVLNPDLAPFGDPDTFIEEEQGAVVSERYRFQSHGSYLSMVVRYWLPRTPFFLDRLLPRSLR